MQLWRKPRPGQRHDRLDIEQVRKRNPGGPAAFAVGPGSGRPSSPVLHAALFLLTLFSMTAAGAMQRGVNPFLAFGQLVHLVEGIPFAATLLGILTVHEFGHYFAARRWGVKASAAVLHPAAVHIVSRYPGSGDPHPLSHTSQESSSRHRRFRTAGRLLRRPGCLRRWSAAVARRRRRLFRATPLRESRALLAARRPPGLRSPVRLADAGDRTGGNGASEPGRLCRMGRSLHHRVQPVPGRAARWRPCFVRRFRPLGTATSHAQPSPC